MDTVDSYHGLEMYGFLLNLKVIFAIGGALMIGVENGLERE